MHRQLDKWRLDAGTFECPWLSRYIEITWKSEGFKVRFPYRWFYLCLADRVAQLVGWIVVWLASNTFNEINGIIRQEGIHRTGFRYVLSNSQCVYFQSRSRCIHLSATRLHQDPARTRHWQWQQFLNYGLIGSRYAWCGAKWPVVNSTYSLAPTRKLICLRFICSAEVLQLCEYQGLSKTLHCQVRGAKQ